MPRNEGVIRVGADRGRSRCREAHSNALAAPKPKADRKAYQLKPDARDRRSWGDYPSAAARTACRMRSPHGAAAPREPWRRLERRSGDCGRVTSGARLNARIGQVLASRAALMIRPM